MKLGIPNKLARTKAPAAEIVKRDKVLSKAEATKLQDGMTADLKAAEGRMVAAAIKLQQFRDGKGWQARGYTSETKWRIAEWNFTDFWNLRNVSRLLDAGVPAAAVEKMSITNQQAMTRYLPERCWTDKAWQQDAIEMPIADFESKAMGKANDAGLHPEALIRRGFAIPASLAEQWDLCLRVCETVDAAGPIDRRIDAIVSAYLNAPSAEPELSKLQLFYRITEPVTAGEF